MAGTAEEHPVVALGPYGVQGIQDLGFRGHAHGEGLEVGRLSRPLAQYLEAGLSEAFNGRAHR